MGVVASQTTVETTYACDGQPLGRPCDTDPVTVVGYDSWPDDWTQTAFSPLKGRHVVEFGKKEHLGQWGSWTTDSTTVTLCPVCSDMLAYFVPSATVIKKRWFSR